MILRVLAVSMIGFTLAGCVSSSGLSGDVYSASEAKQVQSVTYGTIVHTRAVQIQSGDDSNAIGAIGGAVLGGFLGNTIGGRYRTLSGYGGRCGRGRRSRSGRSGRDE
ncbi:outer membrane lipoprotein pcp [Klebsiella pneumoniae]|uniref:Outer membrane lipoprotein pcp n=1 Tax=Klebsiella pneumoniae TaxID=573 RepID=A0A377W071_KLEPN|nr:outer membrane lipoprotein pcp [Klebsiella pneumoniae]